MAKRLPLGIEDFRTLITEDFYFVDKTGLIAELLDNWGEVNLFTRPRRFGKSLNISMLKCFFEIGTDPNLFDGLAISCEGTYCEEYLGQYPVIAISLKDAWGLDYEEAKNGLWSVVGREADRLVGLFSSGFLDEVDREKLTNLRRGQGNLESSLQTLTDLLFDYYGKPVIVLIDEYDVPLQKALEYGYYRQMTTLISRFFSAGMKTNDHMKFAVVTGCLRITKESIFTGFNNPKVHTITDRQYEEWFGFTDAEVRQLLADYGFGDYYGTVKDWYDGFRFGEREVYCPWDVLNYCERLQNGMDDVPQNFWANVSGNTIIRRFADRADAATRDQIAILMEGGTIRKQLNPELTYGELDEHTENLWSVLFITGYLTQCGRHADGSYELRIPNREIHALFESQIDAWFTDKVLSDASGVRAFLDALLAENEQEMEDCLIDYLEQSVSYFDGGRVDGKENFYHGLLLGMLSNLPEFNIVSNREAGKGRLDIVGYRRHEKYAFIIEVKYARHMEELEAAAHEALAQINRNKYDQVFGRHQPQRVVHYGIAFCKTDCRVLKEIQ